MQAAKAAHPVRVMCRVLSVSASGFYAWQQRPASARACTDQRLRVDLRAAHAESGATYGSPRLQQVLRARGLPVGRNRVIRLMRDEQLVGRTPRRWRGTTVSIRDGSSAGRWTRRWRHAWS